jgi:hypothetical protein
MIPRVALLMCSLAGTPPEGAQRANIDQFYQAVCSESATVKDFQVLFGEDSEGELVAAGYARYPKGASSDFRDLTKEQEADLNAQLLEPEQHRSEFLACLRRVWPDVFCSKQKRSVSGPKRAGGLVEYRVVTRRKKVIFQFVPDLSTIEDIRLPDGTSVNSSMAKCIRN